MVKKIIIIYLLAIMPIMSFAEEAIDITSPRVAELIAQKQAKMQRLSKCKGTTKNLKIAGLSTLGVTAVGVAANVAEAVILKEEKGKLSKATSDAVEALCKGEKGLKGDWDSIDKICTVKKESLYSLPIGITCNIARTECSSGDIKVKVKVIASVEEEIEFETVEEETPAEEPAKKEVPTPATEVSGGNASGKGRSGGDVPTKEELPAAEEKAPAVEISGGDAPVKEATPVAEEAPAEEVLGENAPGGDVVTEEASSAQATEAPAQSDSVSSDEIVIESKKISKQKIKQDKRSDNSIKSAKMYAESTLSCDIYNADTDTLHGGAGKCEGMKPGSWIVEYYNGKKDTGLANCLMSKTCYCSKDSAEFEKLYDFDSRLDCANECAFVCVMYWYHDD